VSNREWTGGLGAASKGAARSVGGGWGRRAARRASMTTHGPAVPALTDVVRSH